MTDNELTNLARIPLLMIEYAGQSGIERDEFLQLASINLADPADPDARIPLAAVLDLWRTIIECEDDSAIGLRIGSTVKARRLGLVGYAMLYSCDLSNALQRFARYIHIVSEAVQFEIAEDCDRTTLRFSAHPALVALRHPVEAQIAAVLAISREITQSDVLPIAIQLPFPLPNDQNKYREIYRCPVNFNQQHAAIVLATSQMHLPIRSADPTLGKFLDQLAQRTLDSLDATNGDFMDTVRSALWSELPGGRTNLSRVASELGMSSRTLQRRLNELGTSYSVLLEELRREVAGDLLAEKQLGVADIAFLLGYSEPSALRRAFRRWHGVSPRELRGA